MISSRPFLLVYILQYSGVIKLRLYYVWYSFLSSLSCFFFDRFFFVMLTNQICEKAFRASNCILLNVLDNNKAIMLKVWIATCSRCHQIAQCYFS
jgi:hypothetical protein